MNEHVALFGTSADPPTIAHKKILEELSKIYSLTITFASDNPQKKHREDISIRSFLLNALVEDLDNTRIMFNQKLSSPWAFESIKNCKKIYELNYIDFVIGSDLISDIFYWKNFDKFIKNVSFFIIKREGYPVQSKTLKMLETHKVEYKIANLEIPKISSSIVILKKNYSNLPKSISDIIKKNNLYIHKNS